MAKNSALKKITAHAKSLCKKHPAMSWKSAIMKSSAAYRAGKKKTVSGTHKKRVVHKRKKVSGVRNNVDRVDRKKTTITIAGVKRDGVMLLNEKLGAKEVQKFHAKTKTRKRQLAKEINSIKRDLRKFS